MNRKEFINRLSVAIGAFVIGRNLEAAPIAFNSNNFSSKEFKARIEKILRKYYYEGNTTRTRDNIRSDILNYISDYCNKKNLTNSAYDVICDSSNNTLETIDQNKINVDIVYKANTNDIEFKVLKCTVSMLATEF